MKETKEVKEKQHTNNKNWCFVTAYNSIMNVNKKDDNQENKVKLGEKNKNKTNLHHYSVFYFWKPVSTSKPVLSLHAFEIKIQSRVENWNGNWIIIACSVSSGWTSVAPV